MSLQKKLIEKRYQFPRPLGLDQVSRNRKGHYRLSLGYSKPQRRELQVDRASLDLIHACFSPTTARSLSHKLRAPISNINKACHTLVKAKVLHETQSIPKSLRRYDRHLLFFETAGVNGLETQKRISQSKVALIGMGGIGNWVALNLIGSGLKELRLIDFDRIEESNLTRQVLFSEKDIGQLKTAVAHKVLAPKNSKTNIIEHAMKIKGTPDLEKILRGADMVILSADRPEKIHDWVDEICIKLGIPYINLGYRDGMGVIGPMTVPRKTSCYQCNKPKPEKQSTLPCDPDLKAIYDDFDSRYQAPSFGPLNAWVSTVGALEVLKYLGQFGCVESLDTELNLDPLSLSQARIKYHRDPHCWHCTTQAAL